MFGDVFLLFVSMTLAAQAVKGERGAAPLSIFPAVASSQTALGGIVSCKHSFISRVLRVPYPAVAPCSLLSVWLLAF